MNNPSASDSPACEPRPCEPRSCEPRSCEPRPCEPRLILASASPRRVELLQQLGLPFKQIVSPAIEPAAEGGNPGQHATHSATVKARAVAALITSATGQVRPGLDWRVLGADTVVSLDEQLLGKPTSPSHAREMLTRLSGRQHTVCTGLCITDATGREFTAAAVTQVWMGSLSASAIDAYVESGEPLDKAGSYAIQGLGARFVERIEGCYYNVVGLPLFRLTSLLVTAGFDLDTRPGP